MRHLALVLALASCAHVAEGPTSKTLVLVHGAFADHHAFDGVKPLLEAKGYKVVAPDLLGHGDDSTGLAGISLDAYVDEVAKVVEREGDVILVGHSMAGLVVSQVAEREAARVQALVYVAAYLPQSGQALQKLAEQDPDSLVGKNMEFAPDFSTVSIKKSAVAEAIAADVAPAIQRFIVEGQKPEPLKPFQGTVTLTAERFGKVKKAYLRTELDHAVTPALQAKMLAAYPAVPTWSLATGHLPFVAQPQAFADALVAAIAGAR